MKRAWMFEGGRRIIAVSLLLAAIGVILAVIGGFINLRQLMFSYLAAWTCMVFLAVGALLLLLSCHAMRAGWPVAVRRLLETMIAPLPVLAVLFIPVAVGMGVLYPWVHPERIDDEVARHVIEHRARYLNPGFFIVRAILYFGIWIALAELLRRWSFASDRLADDRRAREALKAKMYVVSGFALPIVSLTVVFSSIDWLMSLERTWYSTMFPVYVFATGFVGAIAVLTIVAYAAQRMGYLVELNDSHYYALGRLLVAFTIFWAYAAFFQFMLMWIANRPDEVAFYLDRWVGPWSAITALLVFVRFIAPFVLLMPYNIKRQPRRLTNVAIWIVVSTYIDIHWLVMPRLRSHGSPYVWLDFVTLAIVAGLTVAFATWRLRGRPIVPVNDPRLEEAFAYRSV